MFLLPVTVLLSTVQTKPVSIQIKQDQQLSKSCTVAQSVYRFSNSDETLAKPVLTVKGSGITVDFNGTVLEGSPQSTDPDQRKGLGILIEGTNITIKNLKIRGYKVGLLARNCTGLKLTDCDFSFNWKQRLLSTVEQEDEADWMSYHHNESDEWLRYGAGAYLKNCDKFEIKNLVVKSGQCGLLLTKCNEGLVWNSDLSFNSGLGLGMYRSSANRIMHNKMDWCVRGYSHGVYNRGQDSAGILVFEQCNKNVFAFNSATHGGDGFFLWAGQETMDSGKGGCNDNLLYSNDLSHSPANAIEATFSRNKFVNNLLIDSWHGVWGGYSYDTQILGNIFAINGESIAIEHGQNNKIAMNSFSDDTVSVYLWQNEAKPDPAWGYPKNRDVRNVGTVVSKNLFTDIAETAIQLGSSTKLYVSENAIVNASAALRIDGTQDSVTLAKNTVFGKGSDPVIPGVNTMNNMWSKAEPTAIKPVITRGGNSLVANEPKGSAYFAQFHTNWTPMVNLPKVVEDAKAQGNTVGIEDMKALAENYVAPLQGGVSAFLPDDSFRGRRYILMEEWGPYNFKHPILWPRGKASYQTNSISKDGQIQSQTVEGNEFEILGPKGKWRVVTKSKGVVLSSESGQVPGKLLANWPPDTQNISIKLEYTGSQTLDQRGVVSRAGESVEFGWSKSYTPIQWDVKFWKWDEQTDPRTQYDAFLKLMEAAPTAKYHSPELSFATSGSPYQGVPANNFATLATGTFLVDGGAYVLKVTTDDGAKVWLDGKLLIDEWHWQGPTPYTRDVELTKGQHSIKVQHFEIDGYTTLKVELKAKK